MYYSTEYARKELNRLSILDVKVLKVYMEDGEFSYFILQKTWLLGEFYGEIDNNGRIRGNEYKESLQKDDCISQIKYFTNRIVYSFVAVTRSIITTINYISLCRFAIIG